MKIEKGVPIPDKVPTGRGRKYPWEEMEVGDSLFFDNKTEYEQARSASGAYARNHEVKFTSRMTLEGYRIWRIQ